MQGYYTAEQAQQIEEIRRFNDNMGTGINKYPDVSQHTGNVISEVYKTLGGNPDFVNNPEHGELLMAGLATNPVVSWAKLNHAGLMQTSKLSDQKFRELVRISFAREGCLTPNGVTEYVRNVLKSFSGPIFGPIVPDKNTVSAESIAAIEKNRPGFTTSPEFVDDALKNYHMSVNAVLQISSKFSEEFRRQKFEIDHLNVTLFRYEEGTRINQLKIKKILVKQGIKISQIESWSQETLSQVNKIYNHLQVQQEKAKLIRSDQEAKAFFNEIHEGFGLLAQVGTLSNSKDLAKIGVVGQHLTTLVMSVGQLTGVFSSFGLLQVVGPAMLNPIVGGIGAIIGIVGMLGAFGKKKRKGNDDNGIGKCLQAIHQAIIAMHNEMREHFQQVYKNQKQIYEAVLNLMNYVVVDFQKPLVADIATFSGLVNHALIMIRTEIREIQLRPISAAITDVNAVLLLENFSCSEEIIKNARNTLRHFVQGESTQESLNGKMLVPIGEIRFKVINELLQDVNVIFSAITIEQGVRPSQWLGLVEALYRLEGGSKFSTQQQVNLELFNSAVEAFQQVVKRCNAETGYLDQVLAKHALKAAKQFMENASKLIVAIQEDREFFLKLEKNYQNALRNLEETINKKMLAQDFKEINTRNFPATIKNVFGENTGDRVDLNKNLDQLEYYKNLLFLFHYVAGHWHELARHQQIWSIREQVENYILFAPETVELPDWSNKPLGKPEYYETLQLGSIRINKTEQLYVAIRDAAGIDLKLYDPNKDIWTTASRGPSWSDDAGFNEPQYYKTIQSNVLRVNATEELYLSIRASEGMQIYAYNPPTDLWIQKKKPPAALSDVNGYNEKCYYSWIKTNVVCLNGQDALSILSRIGGMSAEIYQNNNSYVRTDNLASFDSSWCPPQYSTTATTNTYDQGRKLIFSIMDSDGPRLVSLNVTSQNWFGGKENRIYYHRSLIKYKDNKEYLWKENYLVISSLVLTIHNNDFLFLLERKSEGVAIHKFEILKLKTESLQPDARSSDRHPKFQGSIGFISGGQILKGSDINSIKISPSTINGKAHLIISGLTEEGFMFLGLNPETLAWTELPIEKSYRQNQTGIHQIAGSLKRASLILQDNSEEFVLATLSDHLKLHRYPLSARPLINFLNSTFSTEPRDGLVSQESNFSFILQMVQEIQANITKTINLTSSNNNTSNNDNLKRELRRLLSDNLKEDLQSEFSAVSEVPPVISSAMPCGGSSWIVQLSTLPFLLITSSWNYFSLKIQSINVLGFLNLSQDMSSIEERNEGLHSFENTMLSQMVSDSFQEEANSDSILSKLVFDFPGQDALMLLQIPFARLGRYRDRIRELSELEKEMLLALKKHLDQLLKRIEPLTEKLFHIEPTFISESKQLVDKINVELVPALEEGKGANLVVERLNRLIGYLEKRVIAVEGWVSQFNVSSVEIRKEDVDRFAIESTCLNASKLSNWITSGMSFWQKSAKAIGMPSFPVMAESFSNPNKILQTHFQK